jgi:hypothetical protein
MRYGKEVEGQTANEPGVTTNTLCELLGQFGWMAKLCGGVKLEPLGIG